MALANLLIKIGADISDLKTGSDNAVRAMEKTSAKIDSIGSSITGILAGAFSVDAVVGFGKELLRMGDDIVRTADRTGLLTDEVQKLSFIAGQSGNSLEEITGAIGQLQNRLSSGDKGAVGAVQALGLTLEGLGKLDTYDQMAAIAEAIGRVPDPAKRAQLAMDLFGRSGIALLPTLTAQFKELGDAAPVMAEDTVRALDAAGDAFDKLTLQVKVFAANLYNAAGKAFDKLVADFYRMIGGLYDGTAKIVQLTSKIPGASKVFGDLNDNVQSLTQTSQWYKDAASSLEAGSVKAARTLSTQYAPAVTAAGKAHEVTTTHTKAHVAVIKEEIAILPEVQHALDLLVIAHAHEAAALQFEATQWKATQKANEDYVAHLKTANVVLLDGVRNLSSLVPMIGEAAQATGNLSRAQVVGAAASQSWASVLSAGIKSVGASILDGFAFAGGGAAETLKKFGTNVALDFTKGILGAIPGIGPILEEFAGPLVAGFKKIGSAIAGLFDRNKGRDIVEEFAKGFGGFDALHAQLLDLGAAGEQLWIRLTQGVGRNNPDQARAAIDAINKAFNEQKSQVNDLNGYIDTLGLTLEDLGREAITIPISFDVGDLPDFGGGHSDGYATGTRGAFVDFGAGTPVVLHGRERIVTEGEDLGLDGGTVTLSAPDAMALLQGQIVRVARKDAAKGGVRTRAGRGRSY